MTRRRPRVPRRARRAAGDGAGVPARLEARLAGGKGVIGTCRVATGRWTATTAGSVWSERTRRSSRADAPSAASARAGVEHASYAAGKTDEFVEPFVVGAYAGVDAGQGRGPPLQLPSRPRARADARARARVRRFPRGKRAAVRRPLRVHDDVRQLRSACRSRSRSRLPDIFPEVIARAGLTQFRCAETEKYAHVTYFFNGGREEPFAGEERQMIPSPKDVATYDKKPEMSAAAVADAVGARRSKRVRLHPRQLRQPGHGRPHRGPDRGHHAVEAVDAGLGKHGRGRARKGGRRPHHGRPRQLRADEGPGDRPAAHGPHDEPRAARLRERRRPARSLRSGGRICDVAPTMLQLLGIEQPAAMTGHSLLGERCR